MAEAEAWVMIPKLDKDKTGCVLDMRPLVLCKDCKHGYICEFDVRCENKNAPAMIGQHNGFNWFCADGERRTDDA